VGFTNLPPAELSGRTARRSPDRTILDGILPEATGNLQAVDQAGNSVKVQKVFVYVTETLGLNLYFGPGWQT